jgi:hypothetical protein
MSVAPVGVASIPPQPAQRAPEAAEVKGAPDRDGDADDGGRANAVQQAAKPTVNVFGQPIGQTINVTA